MIYPLTIVREDFVLILIIIFIIYPNEYKEIYSISNTYYYKRYTTIRIINTIIKENREDSKKREELLFTRIGEISKTLSDVANTLALIDERIEKLEEKENR